MSEWKQDTLPSSLNPLMPKTPYTHPNNRADLKIVFRDGWWVFCSQRYKHPVTYAQPNMPATYCGWANMAADLGSGQIALLGVFARWGAISSKDVQCHGQVDACQKESVKYSEDFRTNWLATWYLFTFTTTTYWELINRTSAPNFIWSCYQLTHRSIAY